MILIEADYIGSKPECVRVLKHRGHSEISSLAATIGLPVAMLCLWYLEEVGESEKVRSKLAKIIEFYQYSEIIRIEKAKT